MNSYTTKVSFSKFFIICFAILCGSFVFANEAKAFTVNPASGTYTPGQSVTIQVLAAPQTGESGVELDIRVTGMTITGFQPATGFLVSQGTCAGNSSFTATTVCHLYGDTSALTAGQSLGTITATMGSAGTGTISRGSTEYATADSSRTVTGQAASFTIQAGGTNPNPNPNINTLPNTADDSTDGLADYLYLIVGLTFISLSALVYILRKSFQQA